MSDERLVVIADPEQRAVELNGVQLTPEEARELGEKLIAASSMVEMINPATEEK